MDYLIPLIAKLSFGYNFYFFCMITMFLLTNLFAEENNKISGGTPLMSGVPVNKLSIFWSEVNKLVS